MARNRPGFFQQNQRRYKPKVTASGEVEQGNMWLIMHGEERGNSINLHHNNGMKGDALRVYGGMLALQCR